MRLGRMKAKQRNRDVSGTVTATGPGSGHSPTNRFIAWNLREVRLRVTKATSTASSPVTMPARASAVAATIMLQLIRLDELVLYLLLVHSHWVTKRARPLACTSQAEPGLWPSASHCQWQCEPEARLGASAFRTPPQLEDMRLPRVLRLALTNDTN